MYFVTSATVCLEILIDLLSLSSAFNPKSFGWLPSISNTRNVKIRQVCGFLPWSYNGSQWLTMASRVEKLCHAVLLGRSPSLKSMKRAVRAVCQALRILWVHGDVRCKWKKNGTMPVVSWFRLFPIFPMSLCGAQHAQSFRTHNNPRAISSSHSTSMMLLRGTELHFLNF